MLQKHIIYNSLFIVFIFNIVSIKTQAQFSSYTVRGTLVDSLGETIARAHVRLLSSYDTLSTISSDVGRFTFSGVKSENIQLDITHLAYIQKKLAVTFNKNQTHHQLGEIVLAAKIVKLDELSIEQPLSITFKGDTIDFATLHVKLQEGAFTEDLMRQLPGMQVDRQGRLTFMGEIVEKVRINGIDFFGGNVALALQNLPADLIDRAQLIDDYGEESALSGVKSGKPRKVLNLLMNENKNRGFFVNGLIGLGTADTYTASGTANYFNRKRQFGVSAGKNNLSLPPQQRVINVATGELSGAGIATKGSVEFEVSDGLNEWIDGDFNYRYGDNTSFRNETNIGEQIYDEGRTMRVETTRKRSNIERSHAIGNSGRKATFVFKAPKNKTIARVEPIFYNSETTSIVSGFNRYQLLKNDQRISNQRTTSKSVVKDKQSVDGMNILVNSRLNDGGRNLAIKGNYNKEVGASLEDLENQIEFLNEQDFPGRDSIQRQQIRQENQQEIFRVGVQFVEPIIDDRYLFNLNVSSQWSNQLDNRRVFDKERGIAFVDSLSNRADFNQNETVLGMSFQTNRRKVWYYQAGLNWVRLNQSGRPDSSGEYHQRAVSYMVPRLMIQFAKDRKRISLVYNWQISQPSFSQLNPVTNRTNPQVTLLGNPDLASALKHQFRAQWNKARGDLGEMLTINLSGEYTQNKITQSVNLIQEEGGVIRQEYRYENITGDWLVGGSYNYSIALTKKSVKIGNLNFAGNANFARQRFFEGLVERQPVLISASQSVSTMLWNEKSSFMPALIYNFQYNSIRNTFGMQALHAVIVTANGTLTVWNNFELSSYVSKSFNWGYVGPADANPMIINLSFGYSLFNKRLMLTMQANDLLKQNTNVGRTVSYNEISDHRTNVLGRYFLLSCTWKIGWFANRASLPFGL